ncbi:8-demethyl-8-aminoriboflavin-5'-phosphate (AFP) synthase RosB [Coxiella burnetii]|uniref:BRAMP n=1 Tax=Coxiella burnetii (strain Dugway 5J108-111) TaxID=434922 RepID=A9KDX7_COXBN|nr:flavodoxin family protein [Coxiella burnetii]ABS77573.1 BRAMP [Coxiella burnetii Dugway 5J108-111]OYK80472.1 8-demethyl-8-aminoriboflavin-5'-phosphate (AFP) synthase RosB [Coxiella burnetii]OYK82430.1 8-demethyl-8-aminoriboflavin-5'-phosphate (AFP) synthase RosB [Coxiella burnetii]
MNHASNNSLKALILNCTLKYSPTVSNTEALINKVCSVLKTLDVNCEIIRVVDYKVKFGVSSDEGEGDEWPILLKKIKSCDILIIGTPIWFGERSSVAQMVIERLDGTYEEVDSKTGQFPLYGKVGGVIVTGNEDGAHNAAGTTLFNLSHLGCTIPPNSDCYWVGDAGPGPSYIEAHGDKHMYTNKGARYMAHNLAYMAHLLRKHPIPTNLKHLTKEAEQESSDKCPQRHGESK